jgi:hypothetical protein
LVALDGKENTIVPDDELLTVCDTEGEVLVRLPRTV